MTIDKRTYIKLKKIIMTITFCICIVLASGLFCPLIMNLNHTEVNIRRYDVYSEKFADFQIQEIYDLDARRTYIIYDGSNGCSLLEVMDENGNMIPMSNGILSEG